LIQVKEESMAEREMSVAEAARNLGVTLHHVYALIWGGQLKANRVGGRWRVSAEAVKARHAERGK
jgi:excisionase family DNA binding protein